MSDLVGEHELNCSCFQRPLRIPPNILLGIAKPCSAKAGSKGSWILEFFLASNVPKDRKIILYTHGGRHLERTKWENLQIDDPITEGYVSLKTESGEKLDPIGISDGIIEFEVPKSGLIVGDKIIAELTGVVAPTLSLPNRFVLLLAMPSKQVAFRVRGKQRKYPWLQGETLRTVVGACLMHIVGNDLKRIRAYAKSHAFPDKEIQLLVRPEDENGNVSSDPVGPLVVRIGGTEVKTQRFSIEDSACCVLTGISLSKPGIYRLEVEDVSRGLKTVTNPIKCCRQRLSGGVLWGMIHGHTEISDGSGTLDHYFRYMRDECSLDFGATGDHDNLYETSDGMWRLTQEAVAKYNEPGRFTSFLGYEWAMWRKNGDGDRNVYYLLDRRPMFRSGDECYPKPNDLFKALEKEKALIIPHHTACIGNHCDWKDHDPEKERLVEIYQVRGCSERSVHQGNILPVVGKEVSLGFVQRALEMGWRIGFTAGGDDHQGHSGDQIRYAHYYKAGLMAVFAKENNRESIWEAMWNRKCYATTGARTILDFHINGHPMGSELFLSEHQKLASIRKVSIEVHGTSKIKTVDIVRNNKDVYTFRPENLDFFSDWSDSQPLVHINCPAAKFSSRPFTFYYIRVTQVDKEMAWASPIWIVS